MTDRVLIPLPGIGTLALTAEQYAAALLPIASAEPSRSARNLLTAKQMEERTGKPASWWMSQARERRVDAEKIGRTWMFDLDQALASGGFKRAAVPDGQMHRLGERHG